MMSSTRNLWLLTIFSCVTLVSAGAFATDPATYTVTPSYDYSGGRKIVASKAYVDSQVDSAYVTLDNAKQNKIAGGTEQILTSPAANGGAPRTRDIETSGSDINALASSSASGASDVPTAWAVKEAISGATGGLVTNSHTHADGTYTTKSVNNGNTIIDVNAVTTIDGNASSSDDAKIPTVSAVENYAQKKIDAGTSGNILTYSGTAGTLGTPLVTSGSIDGTASSSDDAKIPTVGAVEGYVNKSEKTFTTNDFVSGVSTAATVAATMNAALSDEKLTTERKAYDIASKAYGQGANVVITDRYESEGQILVSVPGVSAIDGVTGGQNSDDAKIPTVGAVEDYVASQTSSVSGKQNKPNASGVSAGYGKYLMYSTNSFDNDVTAQYVKIPVTSGDPDTYAPTSGNLASIWVQ